MTMNPTGCCERCIKAELDFGAKDNVRIFECAGTCHCHQEKCIVENGKASCGGICPKHFGSEREPTPETPQEKGCDCGESPVYMNVHINTCAKYAQEKSPEGEYD